MTDKEPIKKCLICGDKAICNNFDVMSCDSCKAFFRRNANKTCLPKCHFKDNCRIDVITRGFCKKCRLKKCFNVGMKKELILSEEKKREKRKQIEMNKRKATSDYSSNTDSNDSLSLNSPESVKYNTLSKRQDIKDNYSHEMIETLNLDLDFDIDVINNQISEIDNYIEVKGKTNDYLATVSKSEPIYTSESESDSGLVLDSHEINRQIVNYNGVERETNELSDKLYEKAIEFEFSVISIARPLIDYTNNFNELEGNKLTELLNATKPMITINASKAAIVKSENTTDCCQLLNRKLDQDVIKYIQMSKNLTSFNGICANDQISLVKYGIMELFCLRAIETIDPQNQYMTLILNNENSVVISLDFLKAIPNNIHRTYTRFLRKLRPEWDSDVIVLNLLTAIVLFNPDRPDLVDREQVKSQQHIYMHLLKRYLSMKYRSVCDAKQKFLRILNSAIELGILGKKYLRSFPAYDPNSITPLLEEIFEFK